MLDNDFGKVKWEEIVFIAEDISKNPEMLIKMERYFGKIGVNVFKDGVNVLQKLTEGWIIKIWLDHGGIMPENYKKVYEQRRRA